MLNHSLTDVAGGHGDEEFEKIGGGGDHGCSG